MGKDVVTEDGLELVYGFLAERRGQAASAVEVTPMSGDASTRRYFRLREGGRSHVLALHPEPFDPEDLSFVAVHGLLDSWGLPVPAIVETDGTRGILVLEDLGDLTLQEVLKDASPRDGRISTATPSTTSPCCSGKRPGAPSARPRSRSRSTSRSCPGSCTTS